MKIIKELHDLEHPLYEYVCGIGVDTHLPWDNERRYFVLVGRVVLEDVYQYVFTECTYDEAQAQAAAINGLIKADKALVGECHGWLQLPSPAA